MRDGPSVRELEASVLSSLRHELHELGFESHPRRQEYVLNDPVVSRVVHVGFVRHKDDVDATVDVGLLIKPVEAVLKRAGWPISQGATIGVEIGNLIDGRPHRWHIRSQEDASDASRRMRSQVEEFGFEWFERFSNLETVFRTLAPNNRESWTLMPIQAKRFAILVALSALVRSPEETQDVARASAKLLADSGDPQLSDFQRFTSAVLDPAV